MIKRVFYLFLVWSDICCGDGFSDRCGRCALAAVVTGATESEMNVMFSPAVVLDPPTRRSLKSNLKETIWTSPCNPNSPVQSQHGRLWLTLVIYIPKCVVQEYLGRRLLMPYFLS